MVCSEFVVARYKDLIQKVFDHGNAGKYLTAITANDVVINDAEGLILITNKDIVILETNDDFDMFCGIRHVFLDGTCVNLGSANLTKANLGMAYVDLRFDGRQKVHIKVNGDVMRITKV